MIKLDEMNIVYILIVAVAGVFFGYRLKSLLFTLQIKQEQKYQESLEANKKEEELNLLKILE